MEDLKTYLRSVSIGGQSRDELLEYADSHLDRFLYRVGFGVETDYREMGGYGQGFLRRN
jgi:hypothetical protein